MSFEVSEGSSKDDFGFFKYLLSLVFIGLIIYGDIKFFGLLFG